MADEKKAPNYVWMDVGHLDGPLPDGVSVQGGHYVAVDTDTHEVLADQPDYPEQPADPENEKPAPAEPEAKRK